MVNIWISSKFYLDSESSWESFFYFYPISNICRNLYYYLEGSAEVSRYLSMLGAFLQQQQHFSSFLMLGYRHKYVNLYLNLVAWSSRIYRDVSKLVVIKYTGIVLRQFFCSSWFFVTCSDNYIEIRVCS